MVLVSAGSTIILLGVILPAGCYVSAVPAACILSAVGRLFLLAAFIHAAGVVSAVNTSIYAAELFDFAGWLVSATSHSVSAGSLHSCCSNPASSAFGAPVTDSTVPTPAAMDSAGSRREIGVSPFADSAASSSPSNVSTDHIPIDVLFESTSG
ncbi:hypothetical protein Tco_0113451, partial [Tanacetum coccineum]